MNSFEGEATVAEPPTIAKEVSCHATYLVLRVLSSCKHQLAMRHCTVACFRR